jgi:hypothetical protein
MPNFGEDVRKDFDENSESIVVLQTITRETLEIQESKYHVVSVENFRKQEEKIRKRK